MGPHEHISSPIPDLWSWPASQDEARALLQHLDLRARVLLNGEFEVARFELCCDACSSPVDPAAVLAALRPWLGTAEEMVTVARCGCGHVSYSRSRYSYGPAGISFQNLTPDHRVTSSGVARPAPLSYRVRRRLQAWLPWLR